MAHGYLIKSVVEQVNYLFLEYWQICSLIPCGMCSLKLDIDQL